MTDSGRKREDDWLEALAGRPAGDLPEDELREIQLVRAALQHRAQRLEAGIPATDDALLERIQSAVRRATQPASFSSKAKLVTWAAAASIIGSIALSGSFYVQYAAGPTGGVGDITNLATIISSGDPGARATSILSDLESRRAPWVVRGRPLPPESDAPVGIVQLDLGDGRIMIILDGTEENVDHLASLGIEAAIVDQKIILVVIPK